MNIKKGDWIFTCNMKPLQFSHYEMRDPKKWFEDDYYIFENMTSEEKEKWIKDDFITLEGSSHSKSTCGLNVISRNYAKFFIENKLWELYNEEEGFDNYEEKVKSFCKSKNIIFEGI